MVVRKGLVWSCFPKLSTVYRHWPRGLSISLIWQLLKIVFVNPSGRLVAVRGTEIEFNIPAPLFLETGSFSFFVSLFCIPSFRNYC